MNYHNIVTNDMNNGDGLRVTLFVSGCSHHCKNCQNPQTWDCNSGILFDEESENEIFEELNKDYIDGITLSGGDPLNSNNLNEIYNLCRKIRYKYKSSKTIWLYTGYKYEEIINSDSSLLNHLLSIIDVIVDGKYIEELRDVNSHWKGSSNQRVIDVKKTLKENKIFLLDN